MIQNKTIVIPNSYTFFQISTYGEFLTLYETRKGANERNTKEKEETTTKRTSIGFIIISNPKRKVLLSFIFFLVLSNIV